MITLEKEKEFLIRIAGACKALQIELTIEQQEKLFQYLTQLQKWNKTYNLTSIRDPEQALTHHIFDSLSVVQPIAKYCSDNGIDHPILMDVGSGGGLPGVVLAIVMPRVHITCVDTVEKKIAFIRHVAGTLKLTNLNAKHTRIENLDPAEADLVISRAFASLDDFVTLAGKHIKKDGRLLGMKGKFPDQEITTIIDKDEWSVTHTERLDVPELRAERCLVWMNQKGSK